MLFLVENSYAQPFLISDPYEKAIGGVYEIWEVINLKSYNYLDLYHSDYNEHDGSIKVDLQNLNIGTYHFQIRYFVNGEYSDVEPYTITIKRICERTHRGKRECYNQYDIQFN